jgi:hypothetical protein
MDGLSAIHASNRPSHPWLLVAIWIVAGRTQVLHFIPACSDTHGTARYRTVKVLEFGLNRLLSIEYAWPLRCTAVGLLKQIGVPARLY